MDPLTVSQAAARRGVSRYTIHNWIRAGMPARRLGVYWVVEQVDLDLYRPRPAGNPAFGPGYHQKRLQGRPADHSINS